MGCPYPESGSRTGFCAASVTLPLPGAEERKEYCVNEDRYRCPLLLARVLRGCARA
ncbi:MAG TPA: hypothetical protein VNK06_06235 [Thermodesulfobacteriota bacterium]|nr:hypothetical protein [Thermodesulfobacteriota bacterium]